MFHRATSLAFHSASFFNTARKLLAQLC